MVNDIGRGRRMIVIPFEKAFCQTEEKEAKRAFTESPNWGSRKVLSLRRHQLLLLHCVKECPTAVNTMIIIFCDTIARLACHIIHKKRTWPFCSSSSLRYIRGFVLNSSAWQRAINNQSPTAQCHFYGPCHKSQSFAVVELPQITDSPWSHYTPVQGRLIINMSFAL